MTLKLGKGDYQAIIEHAKLGYPNEACGLVGGRDGAGETFYPTANAANSPTVYLIDSREQLRIMQQMEQAGQDIVAIYHSHVASQAFPSATDVKQAFWPESAILIVSLENMDEPDMRAYRIIDGKICEEVLEIVDNGQGG